MIVDTLPLASEYRDVQITLADGRILCVVAVMKKKA